VDRGVIRFSELVHCGTDVPLARLDYPQELTLKNKALAEFWRFHRLPGRPEPILSSPKPRHYRTTTKRHAFFSGGRLRLSFSLPEQRRPVTHEASALEPREHLALYDLLETMLDEPLFRPLAQALNYAIIRGTYSKRCVILNVHELNAAIVKKSRILLARLSPIDGGVISGFLFVDPERSRYYLDTGTVPGKLKIKNIFGPDYLSVNFDGSRYHFPPTVFSQVNESMVPVMLRKARELLAPAEGQRLLDLYCGYGLFTHYLAPQYREALGVEASREGVEAAEKNARFHEPRARAHFRAWRIENASFVRQLPPPLPGKEVILSDPPRQGMPDSVIAALAHRGPAKVLEACCGIEEMPGQIRAWHAGGYRVRTAQPLDMFAGTPHVEMFILFQPMKG
jgi:tRNA/tmRNA/rRNA uracil-C5-methylase (TrmA/RlmC/RlmD family)